MKRVTGSMTGLLALLSASGAAAVAPGWYGALHGELSFAEETDLQLNGPQVGQVSYDVEYAAGVALGYRPDLRGRGSLLNNARIELEATYREVDFDDLSNRTIAPAGFGGSIESYVVMANAYYDFHNNSNWTPYAGAGLGYASHQFDSVTIQTDDDDGVVAYQGMAGLAYRIEPYNNVDVGFGYRYFGTQEIDVTSATGASVEMDYDSHNIEAFLRVGF